MKVNGEVACEMARELKDGQMELVMRGYGSLTRPVVKESFFTLMEMFLMDNGWMTRPMGSVCTSM